VIGARAARPGRAPPPDGHLTRVLFGQTLGPIDRLACASHLIDGRTHGARAVRSIASAGMSSHGDLGLEQERTLPEPPTVLCIPTTTRRSQTHDANHRDCQELL
jgi:hypothetical protein